MCKLILSPEAEQDLIDIWFYIAKDNSINADRYIDKLYDKSLLLSQNSSIGTERAELMPMLRCFPVDHYLLYYRQIAEGIELIRVLHASRDIFSIF